MSVRVLSLMFLSGLTFSANSMQGIPGFVQKSIQSNAVTDAEIGKKGLSVYHDDITDDQNVGRMKLNQNSLHQAKVWGLTDDEEKRYLALMNNRSAVFYEGLHLNPIDILGLNARNEEERAHFAQLGAQIEAQKVAQNLAWNSAFYKAYNELFKNQSVVSEDFDPSLYSPMAHKPIQLVAKDELFLFIKPTDSSKSIVMTLMDAVVSNPGTKVHLMFLDASTEVIQNLAHGFGISFDAVRSGIVTLNQGDLHFSGIALKDKSTPLLILVREGASSVVYLGNI